MGKNMRIHNMMEEYVTKRVNKLYDDFAKEKPGWLHCTCEDCRMDVISYVLNRVPPRYVVSGRGVLHGERVLSQSQLSADVDTISIEGIRLISASKRPYHKKPGIASRSAEEETAFSFPVFVGTVLDGSTFEPMSDVTVTLLMNDKNADMLDKTWSNPCTTCAATKGVYSFWVSPLPSRTECETQKYIFTLMFSAEDYSPVTYSFDLTIVSKKYKKMAMDSSFSLKIQDMFMFRLDVTNPQE